MSKASGKVKKKIYFCTNVILSVMYTWMRRWEGGLVLFLLQREASVLSDLLGRETEQGPRLHDVAQAWWRPACAGSLLSGRVPATTAARN